MNPTRAQGFPPVFDRNSRVLILGSFPSVMSRAVQFYYGNPRNRFWHTVCDFFGEEVPESIEVRKQFLLRRGIALWDVVTCCTVQGSADASIEGEEIADLPALLQGSSIEAILCNGTKAYELLKEHFPSLLGITQKLCSTSPANPRFSAGEWHAALEKLFPAAH